MNSISSFSLRCGIKFGESREEVKNHETIQLVVSDYFNTISYVGIIGGLLSGIINYTFKNDQLIHMSYVFENSSYIGSSKASEEQEKINKTKKLLTDGLKKKYGTPQYIEDSLQNISRGSEFHDLIKNVLYYENCKDRYGYDKAYDNNLQAWVLPDKNGHVIIVLHAFTREDNSSRNQITYSIELGYLYISDEKYNKIMEEQSARETLIKVEQAKKEMDFLNDL